MDNELQQRVLQWKHRLQNDSREEKVLRVLQKLQRVPISVELLKATEIGKVVNKLRKKNGEVGTQAQTIVTKWKEIASSQKPAAELEPESKSNPYLSVYSSSSTDKTSYNPDNALKDYDSFRKTAKKPSSSPEKKHKDKKHSQKNGESKSSKSSSSSSSSSNGKRKHSSSKTKELRKLKEQDDFDNSTASFEACLGFNDAVTLKKKKPTPNTSRDKHSKKIKDSSSKDSKSNSSNNLPVVDNVLENTVTKADILSTLPKIQPDYKPTPRFEPSSHSHSFKAASENYVDDMFANNKSSRTKLYSGRVNCFLPEVLSLQDSCVRVLSENIDGIQYLGNVPYFIIKPVLENCTAQQLYAIEYFNSYLVDETDELWQSFATKQFRNKEPDEMESWREMYLRLSDEREAKLKSITANISASMAKATPERKTKLAYVDAVAKPPRSVARMQARQGTGLPVGYRMKGGPANQATSRPKAPFINSSNSSSSSNFNSQKKAKPSAAPLMQKTLKFMKNRFRR